MLCSPSGLIGGIDDVTASCQDIGPWTLCCSGCSRPTSTPRTSQRTTTATTAGTLQTRRSAPRRRECANIYMMGTRFYKKNYTFLYKYIKSDVYPVLCLYTFPVAEYLRCLRFIYFWPLCGRNTQTKPVWVFYRAEVSQIQQKAKYQEKFKCILKLKESTVVKKEILTFECLFKFRL